jgi:hypothetical protein
VDYEETFAPVSRLSNIRLMLSVACRGGWKVIQIDVKTAFLHGQVSGFDVFMKQPPGFIDGNGKVVRLKKCLYGLKQAPKEWYEKLAACLTDLGFVVCSADSSFWINRKYPEKPVFLCSVVDDMAITSPDPEEAVRQARAILSIFPGTMNGEQLSFYNGLRAEWLQGNSRCILLQNAHVDRMVEHYEDLADLTVAKLIPMKNGLRLCISGTSDSPDSPMLDVEIYPYRALIGSLNYLACGTRPDITYSVNQLAKYANAPRVAHWESAIQVLQYLISTKYWGILLGGGGSVDKVWVTRLPKPDGRSLSKEAVAYADANHGVGIDDRRSVSGMLIQVLGGPISWASKGQPFQTVSTSESEMYAMSTAAREALWLAKLLKEFDIRGRPFEVRGDSQTAIYAVKNFTYTKHTKHIGIHMDFLRDRYRLGDLDFEHIPGPENPADMFTKALPYPAFRKHRQSLAMMELPVKLRERKKGT